MSISDSPTDASAAQEQSNANQNPYRAHPPDSQFYDEVRIVTVPRYKTSHYSGDEWRISAKVEFMYKGRVVLEGFDSTVDGAIQRLPTILRDAERQAMDDGKCLKERDLSMCDQEGCAQQATVTYRMKQEGCNQCGHKRPAEWMGSMPMIRRFCAQHSTRGDCGLEDADRNYELAEGDVAQPPADDVSPSAFGGIVTVEGTFRGIVTAEGSITA